MPDLSELCEPDSPITYGVVQPGPVDPNGVKFIRGGDVSDGKIAESELRTISAEVSNQYKRTILRGGELLVSLVGNPGEVALVPSHMAGLNIARQVAMVRLSNQINSKFLMYFLMSPMGRSALGAQAIGSVQSVINLRDLKRVEVPSIERSTQDKIAEILGTLDDKIELNRRMNETLEEMARALFRDWFVDFGPTRRQMDGATDPAAIMGHAFPPEKATTLAPLFPAKLGDDGLPEGWRKGTLQDFGTIKNGFAFKSKDWRDEGIPVVKIKNVKPRLVSLDGAGFIDPELAREKERFRLAAGDILVGMTGYVGEVGRVPDVKPLPMLNQRVGQIVAEYCEGFSPFLFAATRQPEFKEHAIARSHGSAQANVSSKDLGLFSIAKSCFETVCEFDEVASPLFERMQIADTENQTLAEMRDLLLPKLMSGEIRLKDAEAMV